MNNFIFKLKNTSNLVLIILLLLFFSQIKAQDLCNNPSYEKGSFDISNSSICIPGVITISNASLVKNAKYIFEYSGESLEWVKANAVSANTKNYTSINLKPEIYTILQVGEVNGKTSVACKNVVARAYSTPIYSYSVCGTNSLEVNIPVHPLNDFDAYEISIGPSIINISKSDLPYNLKKNSTFPILIRVKGVYSDPSKGCPGVVPYSNIPAPTVISSGLGYPYHPNIDEVRLESKTLAIVKFSGAYLNTSIADEQYHLYSYKKGSPVNVNSANIANIKPGSYSIPLSDSTNSYCFYVQRKKNACGQVERSAEMCTHPIYKIDFIPYNYLIQWDRYPNSQFGLPNRPGNIQFSTQNLERIENDKTQNSFFQTSTASSYSDNQIDCKQKYCYRITQYVFGTSNSLVFNGESISNQICVDRSKIVAPKITDAWVSTNQDNKNIVSFAANNSWPIKIDKFFGYKVTNGVFNKFDSVSNVSNSISDKELVTKSETYGISYVDRCNSKSEMSDSLKSVFLDKKDLNNIFWTKESPFASQEIKEYNVEYIDENGTNVIENKTFDNNTFNHFVSFDKYDENAKFRLKVTSDGTPKHESYSNTLTFPVSVIIMIPNAFSPNGDSENETYGVKGKTTNVTSFNLQIFNRFGEKLIEFKDPSEVWDGNVNGKPAQAGTYIFKLYATQKNGEIISKNGTIELLK